MPDLLPQQPGKFLTYACCDSLPGLVPSANPTAGSRCGPMPVTALSGTASNRVEGFVRDALGCACPPAVFGDIRLETDPAGFPDIPGARLLAIGGRLLVLLVDAAATDRAVPQVNTLLRRGRDLRDAGGFNRFRLVIVGPQGEHARTPATTGLDSVVREDGRLHLHMIAPSQLPAVLRAPAEVR